MSALLYLPILLAPTLPQSPDELTLVADLNQAPSDSVQADDLRVLGGDGQWVWFTAVGSEGRELYRTDGTPGGTEALAEIFPGYPGAFELDADSSSDLYPLPGGNGAAPVTARGPGVGVELWRVDGPSQAPTLLSDIAPGVAGSFPEDLTEFAGRVWFLADDGVHGREVWSTDGTPSGTRLEFELVVGSGSVFEGPTAARDGRLMSDGSSLFIGRTVLEVNGFFELYGSDGTQAGTQLLATFPGKFSEGPLYDDNWSILGGKVLFSLQRGFSTTLVGADLIVESDGTVAGTQVLAERPPSIERNWVVSDGALAFVRGDGSLVAVGGSPPTVTEVAGLGLDVDRPTEAVGVFHGGAFFFAARKRAPVNLGDELIQSDGTLAGTDIAADVAPGVVSSGPQALVSVGGELYFRAFSSGATGFELHRYLSGGGAQLVADLQPGPPGAVYAGDPVLATPHGAVFTAALTGESADLRRVDASSVTTLLENPAQANLSSFPSNFTRVGNRLFFRAVPEEGGLRGLGFVDLDDPTPRFADLFANGEPAIGAGLLYEYDGGVVFTANETPTGGAAWWWSDGDSHVRLTPDGVIGVTEPPAVLDGALWLRAFGPGIGDELWVSHGEPLDAVPLDLTPGPNGTSPRFLNVVGDELSFINYGPNSTFPVRQLWFTDGTLANSRTVLPPGVTASEFTAFESVANGDLLLVAAVDVCCGFEPFISDGTSAGTFQLVELSQGFDPSSLTRMTPFREGFLFNGGDESTEGSIWFTDGTAVGTTQLLASAFERWFAVTGDAFFHEVEGGVGLFDGDPLVSTPVPAFGFAEGFFDPPPGPPAIVGDRALAFLSDEFNGSELWVLPGPTADPVWVADSWNGEGSGAQSWVTPFGGELYFSAQSPNIGVELHSTGLAGTGVAGVDSIGTGCGGTLAGLTATVGARLGAGFELELEGAQPQAAVVSFFGLEYVGDPGFDVCSIPFTPLFQSQVLVADLEGKATFQGQVPANPALVGQLFYQAAFAVELGGPFLGLGSISNTLEFLIGE